jgi:ribosomal-protein-alanine N-acetyltransferase
MYQALATILPYAFGPMDVHRVEAFVETENIASGKLLQRLGFQHEGTLQDTEIKKGRFISLHVFALLNKK